MIASQAGHAAGPTPLAVPQQPGTPATAGTVPGCGRLSESTWPTVAADETGRALLETVKDLRRRCALRATDDDIIQVAGLVRRLLLDETKLWAEANKALKL